MTETNGLEIENDKENISLYFFFVPTPSGIFLHPWTCFDGYFNSRIMKSDKVKVVVANSSTGKIYQDKSFSYQVSAPKKVKQ
jgi:hypothetical protein